MVLERNNLEKRLPTISLLFNFSVTILHLSTFQSGLVNDAHEFAGKAFMTGGFTPRAPLDFNVCKQTGE
jgi:hypothetical protein